METGQEEVETERQENETQNDEENDVVLVEKAYLYLTDGSYPEGAIKNDKPSIRRKAGRLNIRHGELYYKKRGGVEVSTCETVLLRLVYFYHTQFVFVCFTHFRIIVRFVSSSTLKREEGSWSHVTNIPHLGTWVVRGHCPGSQSVSCGLVSLKMSRRW